MWPTLKATWTVLKERRRQHTLWGRQTHPDGTGSVADVIAAARSKTVCDISFRSGNPSWRLILEEEVAEAFAERDPHKLREELSQVAAVALSWMEAIDRRTHEKE